jgi:hypothetical protein
MVAEMTRLPNNHDRWYELSSVLWSNLWIADQVRNDVVKKT